MATSSIGPVVTCALLATCATTMLTAIASADTTDSCGYLPTMNAERAAHGLPALEMHDDLSRIAQAWADHMSSTGRLEHDPGLSSAVSNWQAVGENVGEGPTIADLASAFAASPEHMANIVDASYTDVGVGCSRRDGIIWITIDFRDPLGATSTTAAPSTTPAAGSSAATAVPSPATRTPGILHLGSTGPAVARWQRRLHVSADGIFGPVTWRALRRFQRAHGLVADGLLGPRTRSAFRQSSLHGQTVRASRGSARRMIQQLTPPHGPTTAVPTSGHWLRRLATTLVRPWQQLVLILTDDSTQPHRG